MYNQLTSCSLKPSSFLAIYQYLPEFSTWLIVKLSCPHDKMFLNQGLSCCEVNCCSCINIRQIGCQCVCGGGRG